MGFLANKDERKGRAVRKNSANKGCTGSLAILVGIPVFQIICVFLFAGLLGAQEKGEPVPPPAATTPAIIPAITPAITPPAAPPQRSDLNLLGKTDSSTGESRRNENVQFNSIDNNALKEVKIRIGATATVVSAFEPERNYFASEYGDKPTSPLHLASQPLRDFHGSFYESHNNSIFNARSFFQVGGLKPAHQNDYGFNITAPLWSGANLSIEGSEQRIRGSVNGNVLVPTAEERTPLTTDPGTRALVQRFLNAFHNELPNRTDINPRALNTNSPQNIDTNNGGARLDQILGNRDRIALRYQFTSQQVDAFELIAGQNPDTTIKSHSSTATWTRNWTSSTLTNLSAGFERVHSLLVPEPNAVGPNVTFGSVLDPLGPGSDLPIDRAQNRFLYAGQVRQVHGSHTWTAGGEIARRQINGDEASSQRGVIYFRNDFGHDAITNFRLGLPSRFSTGIGDSRRGFRNWESQFYAGDNWHVSPSLTLNYGLRYQPVTGPTEVNRLTPIPYGCDCNNFAPRFGFAYRLPTAGIVRGAYGVQFGEVFPVTFQQLRFNPPLFRKIEIQAPSLIDPIGHLSAAETGPNARVTLFDLPSNLATPYSHQYNFSWEPPAILGAKLQLAYIGSRSHKLLMMWITNRAQPVAGIPQTTATIEERRPDQRYFEVRRALNASRAYFDAARVSAVLPQKKGVTLDAAYWFGKAIDVGGNYTNTAAADDARQGRSQAETYILQDLKGVSAFDQTHSFLARATWITFKSWTLSGILLAKTGTPFDILSGSDGPGFGNVDGSQGDRPNLLDSTILGRTIGNPDTSALLLPRSAFGYMNATDSRGNLGRNVFRKGGIRNLNAALSKTWKIRGERSLTFRAESVNLLNTPQFAEPGKELASSNFGQITNTLNEGRTFQFQIRLRF